MLKNRRARLCVGPLLFFLLSSFFFITLSFSTLHTDAVRLLSQALPSSCPLAFQNKSPAVAVIVCYISLFKRKKGLCRTLRKLQCCKLQRKYDYRGRRQIREETKQNSTLTEASAGVLQIYGHQPVCFCILVSWYKGRVACRKPPCLFKLMELM